MQKKAPPSQSITSRQLPRHNTTLSPTSFVECKLGTLSLATKGFRGSRLAPEAVDSSVVGCFPLRVGFTFPLLASLTGSFKPPAAPSLRLVTKFATALTALFSLSEVETTAVVPLRFLNYGHCLGLLSVMTLVNNQCQVMNRNNHT